MTVEELIEKLQEMPKNFKVIIKFYETGDQTILDQTIYSIDNDGKQIVIYPF